MAAVWTGLATEDRRAEVPIRREAIVFVCETDFLQLYNQERWKRKEEWGEGKGRKEIIRELPLPFFGVDFFP